MITMEIVVQLGGRYIAKPLGYAGHNGEGLLFVEPLYTTSKKFEDSNALWKQHPKTGKIVCFTETFILNDFGKYVLLIYLNNSKFFFLLINGYISFLFFS